MFRIILTSLFVASVAGQCSFENQDMSARWQVVNNELTVQFINKNIGNNQWTAIAFGENMSNLEVVLFAIQNNKASIRTGYTSGYGPPTFDNSVSVVPERVMFNSNQLSTRFTRPLGVSGPRGSNLTQCMTWNFISNGSYEDGDVGYHRSSPIGVEVCPRKCRKRAN
ncbi:unnamed protein product [Auanema sp. JU1783]|nr:unnamed protein product [Auanema sp. JU1783]